jgi:hypothetical protein
LHAIVATPIGLVAKEVGLEIERRGLINTAAPMRIGGGKVEEEGLVALSPIRAVR